MSKLTPLQEEVIKQTYEATGSKRATMRETGHDWRAVARVLAGGQAQTPQGSEEGRIDDGIDYDRLAALVAARLNISQSAPVDEGPLAPQEWRQPRQPGIYDAPRLFERIVWLSDLHYPYQDQAAIDAALDFCRDWKPTLVIIGGDLYDSYMISGYEKSPDQLNHHLQREFDLAKPFVKEVDGLGSEVVYILGNHEARIDALIAKNPGLAKLRALEWHRMAELPERWQILPQYSRYRVGSLDFHHGDLKQGPGGRYVAARMLEDLKRSSVFGHFHRSQTYTEPDGDGVLRAGFGAGHLCNTTEAAKYCRLNRWATGFISVDMDPREGLYEVRSHLIHGGRTRIDGRTYSGG